MKSIYGLPQGVKIYFSSEAAVKRFVENKIIEIFSRWGYDFILPPTFGFYNNLVRTFDRTFQNKVYKFVDRDGEVLTLRPDFTAQIIRLLATSFKDYVTPVRISYLGNVFIQTTREEANLREYYQTGVEYFDEKSKIDESELLALTINILDKLSIPKYNIIVGNVGVILKIIEVNGLFSHKQQIFEALSLKNYDMLLSLTNSKRIADIVNFVGDDAMLKNAMDSFPEAASEIKYLQQISERLERGQQGLPKNVIFDLSETHSLPYYSSFVFEVYVKGLGYKIISGGRYDRLCAEYGLSLAGCGFAVNIDKLLQVINISDTAAERVLVIGGRLYSVEQRMRSQGKTVEYMAEDDINERVINYAKNRGISQIIIQSEKPKIYNVLTGEMQNFHKVGSDPIF